MIKNKKISKLLLFIIPIQIFKEDKKSQISQNNKNSNLQVQKLNSQLVQKLKDRKLIQFMINFYKTKKFQIFQI